MIKELSTALWEYQRTTKQEIENIKKIVEKRLKISANEYEKCHKMKIEINNKIQNIIERYKETTQNNEKLKNIVEEMTSRDNIELKHSSYSEFKNQIIKHAKARKTRNKNIAKTILYDRYRANEQK